MLTPLELLLGGGLVLLGAWLRARLLRAARAPLGRRLLRRPAARVGCGPSQGAEPLLTSTRLWAGVIAESWASDRVFPAASAIRQPTT